MKVDPGRIVGLADGCTEMCHRDEIRLGVLEGRFYPVDLDAFDICTLAQ